jgi:hypothetical protein
MEGMHSGIRWVVLLAIVTSCTPVTRSATRPLTTRVDTHMDAADAALRKACYDCLYRALANL